MQALYVTIKTIKDINVLSILDIAVVTFIFYKIYNLIKETRAEQLLKGILLVFLLIPVSEILHLNTLNWILNKTLPLGLVTFVIIFQPEIRRALEHIGRSTFEKHIMEDDEAMYKVITEVANAVENLAESKTGALIVIEQRTGLGEVINNGTKLDAIVSSAILENIFVVNTPLHDGATVIRNDRIISAGCVLPLTNNNDINKKLGTRHRAAIGISETSDALTIVVSEETGTVSLAVNGGLTRNYDKDRLKNILIKIMQYRKKRKISFKEKVKGWIKGERKIS
ncbi:diadenylate cyclase CdaA [Haloimpatiens sp. FM7315]|uniref:diadenylate cyclase CdaA n=1 Tax=Haloimpatiens sp. FM7315 TaxID=3298609 RepID=UPI0035A3940F